MQAAPEKIVVRGVNWLGDAVMTTPALRRLREALPADEIVLLTPAKLAGLWTAHPAVNRVLTIAPDESVWSVGRRLRAERFDTALIFPNSPRTALEAFLGRVPRRVGTARSWRRWLLTQAVPPRADEVLMHKRTAAEVRAIIGGAAGTSTRPIASLPPRAHHVHQYLNLTNALGANPDPLPPLIAVAAGEQTTVRSKFGLAQLNPDWPVVGLNPGAEYGPAKRWPAERFAEAAVRLGQARAWELGLWVFGGPADRELAESIVSRIRAQVPPAAQARIQCLAGQTSLRELCAALQVCRVLLTNDTGPMHVAAAVGTPVVVPFGSTSWRLTGPGLPGDARHRFLDGGAPCTPCFLRECPIDLRCMNGISVEAAVLALESLLQPVP